MHSGLNPVSANPTEWSNTLKQFVGNLLTNCLSVFDRFVGLALKGLNRRSTPGGNKICKTKSHMHLHTS